MAKEKKYEFQSGFEPVEGQVFPAPSSFEESLEQAFGPGLYRVVFYVVTSTEPKEEREEIDQLRFPPVTKHDDDPDADPWGLVQLCASRCYHHQAQYTDSLTYRLRCFSRRDKAKAAEAWATLNTEQGAAQTPKPTDNPFFETDAYGISGSQDHFTRTFSAMSAEQRLAHKELRIDLAASREMNTQLITELFSMVRTLHHRNDANERMFDRGLNMFVEGISIRTEAAIESAHASTEAKVAHARFDALEKKAQREFQKDLLKKMAPVGLFAAGDAATKKGHKGLGKILQKMARKSAEDPDSLPENIAGFLMPGSTKDDKEESTSSATPIKPDPIDVLDVTTPTQRNDTPLLALSRLLAESLSEAQQRAVHDVVGEEAWTFFLTAAEGETEEIVADAMLSFVVEAFAGEGESDHKTAKVKAILSLGQQAVLDELTKRMSDDMDGPLDTDKYIKLFGGTVTQIEDKPPSPSPASTTPANGTAQPDATLQSELEQLRAELARSQEENTSLKATSKPKPARPSRSRKKPGRKTAPKKGPKKASKTSPGRRA